MHTTYGVLLPIVDSLNDETLLLKNEDMVLNSYLTSVDCGGEEVHLLQTNVAE